MVDLCELGLTLEALSSCGLIFGSSDCVTDGVLSGVVSGVGKSALASDTPSTMLSFEGVEACRLICLVSDEEISIDCLSGVGGRVGVLKLLCRKTSSISGE